MLSVRSLRLWGPLKTGLEISNFKMRRRGRDLDREDTHDWRFGDDQNVQARKMPDKFQEDLSTLKRAFLYLFFLYYTIKVGKTNYRMK